MKRPVATLALLALSALSRAQQFELHSATAHLDINGTGIYPPAPFSPSIPLFNPTGGRTLTSVEVRFSTTLDVIFRGTFSAPTGSRTLTLSSSDQLLIGPASVAFNGSLSTTRTFTEGFTHQVPFRFGGSRTMTPANLEAFTGTGVLSPMTWQTVVSFAGSGFTNTSLLGSSDATLQVKYLYAVPEPTSLAVLSIGGLCALLGKKRRARG